MQAVKANHWGGLLGLAVLGSALILAPGVEAKTFTVNSTADVGDFDKGDGKCEVNAVPPSGTNTCTLRAAVEEANEASGKDVIKFKSGLGQIDVGSQIVIKNPVDIKDTNGGAKQVIDGGGAGRIFRIDSPLAVVKLIKLVLKNGRANMGGGCIRIDEAISVTLKNTNLIDCRAPSGDGGAVENLSSGILKVRHGLFKNNSAGDEGGAIGCGDLNVRKATTFKGNVAEGDDGGAVSNDVGGVMDIRKAVFKQNVAADAGGAVASYHGSDNVSNSTFKQNAAPEITGSGNAICDEGGGSFPGNNFGGGQSISGPCD